MCCPDPHTQKASLLPADDPVHNHEPRVTLEALIVTRKRDSGQAEPLVCRRSAQVGEFPSKRGSVLGPAASDAAPRRQGCPRPRAATQLNTADEVSPRPLSRTPRSSHGHRVEAAPLPQPPPAGSLRSPVTRSPRPVGQLPLGCRPAPQIPFPPEQLHGPSRASPARA